PALNVIQPSGSEPWGSTRSPVSEKVATSDFKRHVPTSGPKPDSLSVFMCTRTSAYVLYRTVVHLGVVTFVGRISATLLTRLVLLQISLDLCISAPSSADIATFCRKPLAGLPTHTGDVSCIVVIYYGPGWIRPAS